MMGAGFSAERDDWPVCVLDDGSVYRDDEEVDEAEASANRTRHRFSSTPTPKRRRGSTNSERPSMTS